MATFTSIFVPGADGTFTVGATSAGATVTLGKRTIFAITSPAAFSIIFFNAANAKVPTASNFQVPANMVAVYDLSDYYDSFAVFNNTASTITVWYQTLNRG